MQCDAVKDAKDDAMRGEEVEEIGEGKERNICGHRGGWHSLRATINVLPEAV